MLFCSSLTEVTETAAGRLKVLLSSFLMQTSDGRFAALCNSRFHWSCTCWLGRFKTLLSSLLLTNTGLVMFNSPRSDQKSSLLIGQLRNSSILLYKTRRLRARTRIPDGRFNKRMVTSGGPEYPHSCNLKSYLAAYSFEGLLLRTSPSCEWFPQELFRSETCLLIG